MNEVELTDSLNKFVDGLLESVAAGYKTVHLTDGVKVTKLDEFHVTLSKTFQLKHSAADQLVKSFENEFKTSADSADQPRAQ